jgi:hypothetical protein
VYGEHRRREIRPRSRFIEVPIPAKSFIGGLFQTFLQIQARVSSTSVDYGAHAGDEKSMMMFDWTLLSKNPCKLNCASAFNLDFPLDPISNGSH